MSSLFSSLICRNCSAAATQRLCCRSFAKAVASRVQPRLRLQCHHLSTLSFPAVLLSSQHCSPRRSAGQFTLASTRYTTRRLGSMAGNAVEQDVNPQQALRPLPANGQLNSNGSGLSVGQPKAATKKRNREDADAHLATASNQPAVTASDAATAPGQVAQNGHHASQTQPPAQQPLSSNVEDSVQQAAELLKNDSGLLPQSGSNHDAAATVHQAGANIKPKQPRGKRAKPAAAQPAPSSDQQAVDGQPQAQLDAGSQKSKRAKVAQAVAAAKVLLEQEHATQDPAIANAPLAEKPDLPSVPEASASEAAAEPVPKKRRGRSAKAAAADGNNEQSMSEHSEGAVDAQPAAPKPRGAARRKVAAAAVVESKQEATAAADVVKPEPMENVQQEAAAVAGEVKQEPAAATVDAQQQPAAVADDAQQVPSWYVTDVSAHRASEPAAPKPRKSRAKKAAEEPSSSEVSDVSAQGGSEAALPKPRKSRAKKAAAPPLKEEPSSSEVSAEAALETSDASAQGNPEPAAPKLRKSRAKKAAAPPTEEEPSTSEVSVEAAAESSDASAQGGPEPAAPKARKGRGKKAAAPPLKEEASTSEVSAEAASEMRAASSAGTKKPARSRKKVAALAVKEEPSTSDADANTEAAAKEAPAKKAPARSRKKATPAVKEEPSASETSEEDVQVTGQDSVKKVTKPRRRKFDNELTVRLLAAAKAALAAPETVVVPPRPIPNLGYACLNSTLQLQKPPVTTNRGAILRTFEEKGLPHISQLALQNCKDLLPIIQWNHEHNIRLFRLSSDLFPWGDSGKYQLNELPDLPEIKEVLAEAGQLARLYQQRLTAHPSEFCKMAAPREEVLEKSILALEVHSKVFDMLGYEPNLWNKTNIHIGGTYDDKAATLERFATNFHRLSSNAQKRLAVENDDKASQWSITDLLPLHDKIGVPLTFDFHHHRFCDGGLTHEQAFKAAIATWPKGIRPQCHWSEEPEDPEKVRRAHSKYIRGPMNFYGHEADVDVMIEAKSKEMTLLDFRQYAQHDIELPGAADEHDGKIYDRITQEKEDLKQLKVKEEQVQELQAAAAPFL